MDPTAASGPVVVLPTCLGDIAYPEVTGHTVAVLRASGCDARPCQSATCCGQPAWNSGFHTAARRVAGATLRALARTEGPIVVPSGSCAAMISRHWQHLFHGRRQEAEARAIAARTVELSAFLAGSPPLGRPLHGRGRIGYHDSCHMLRELSISQEPRRLLATIDGADLIEVPGHERCCGFGGTFAVRYPEVSVAMADAKLDQAGGCDVLVSCDGGCIMQLRGRAERRGLPVRVAHLATVLYEAGMR